MIIINQFEDLLFDFEKPIKYTTDKDGRVYATFADDHSELLGKYDDKAHACYVIGLMANAYDDGLRKFFLPNAVEVRTAMMNRHCNPVRRTGAAKGHGGT